MMAIGLIGAIGSGIVGMMGAQQQAQAAQASAQQNAQIADYNRQVAERNKHAALVQADQDATDQSREGSRKLAMIRNAYGASGLSIDGSPLDVIADTALEQELDVSKTRYKGQLKAIGYEDDAANYKMKQQLYLNEAASAGRAGSISAVGAIFGAFGSASKVGMSMAA